MAIVKKRILMVDDEQEMRRKYKKFLTKEGYKVVEAPKAIEVANVLMREKSRLDLILLDINLPEVDGRDIAEIIQEYAPTIPIIVMSVLPVREQKLRIPWAIGYYNKADSRDLLLAKVKKVAG